jgi:acetyltransferase
MNIEEKLDLMKVMFNPKSVAVMGATDNIMKIGAYVFGSVLGCGFAKPLYGINPSPKYENKKIMGNDVYPSLDKCPEPIDLVGIVVPPHAVLDSIKQAIENDVRTAAIITAGFGEVKTEERQDENKELIKTADKGGLIFVGPNSMGFYSSEDKISPLHLGFGFMMPRPGNLSIVSQSGTMGTVLCNAFQKIRYFVSSGNEASLTLEDYLEYYARDPETKTIALFAEGLRAGSRFKEISGSITGSLNIYKSLFKQTGVILADQIEQFIYLVKGAQYLLPLPTNGDLRAGIISGGGGFVVHLTDLCEKHGINVVDLRTEPNGQKLIEDISNHLPFYWSHNNPVDMVATGDPNVYQTVTELMLNSGCFDVIITMSSATFLDRMKLLKPMNDFGKKMIEMMTYRAKKRSEKAIESEIALRQKFPDKRMIYISFGTSLGSLTLEKYDENEIMIFGGNPENAAIVLKKLHEYQKFINL